MALGQPLGRVVQRRSSARGSRPGPCPARACAAPAAAASMRAALLGARPAPRPARSARSHVGEHGVGLVAGLDEQPRVSTSASAYVERVLDHPLDLGLAEPVGRLHLDRGRLAGPRCSLACTCRMPLASIRNVTSIFGMPAGMGSMPRSSKRASERLSLRQLALPLHHVHVHHRLPVDRGREHLACAHGRDGRVARDQHAHDAAQRLDAERQRGDVEQQHVGDAAGQDLRLHRGAQRHHLVRVQLAVRRLAEQLLHPPAHQRHAGGAAHQHHLVDVARSQAGVAQAPAGRARGSRATSGSISAFELGPRDVAPVREASRRAGSAWSAPRTTGGILAASAASRSSCIASASPVEVARRARVPDLVLQQPVARSRGRSRRRPRCVSPLVASTSKMPSLTRRIEMSKVPPPRS